MRITKAMAVLVAVAALLVVAYTPAAAQTGQVQSFSLPVGATATVSFEAFCSEFGQKFPSTVVAPNGVTADKVRAALAYVQKQGLSASGPNALEAQYALWQLLGTTTSPKGGAIAQQVITNATTPPQNPPGISLIEAARSGQIKLSIASFAPVGSPVQVAPGATDNFYGRGQFTITNASNQALILYMPVGTIIPAAKPAEQDLVGYATEVKVNVPAVPTQPAPTPRAPAAPAPQLPQTAGSAPLPFATLFLATLWLLVVGVVALRKRR